MTPLMISARVTDRDLTFRYALCSMRIGRGEDTYGIEARIATYIVDALAGDSFARMQASCYIIVERAREAIEMDSASH